jgi:hypothetical protein
MEFRWVAAIALWTFLSGPVFNGKGSLSAPAPQKASSLGSKESAVSTNSVATIQMASRSHTRN